MDEPEQNRGGLYRVTSYFWLMDTQKGRDEQPRGTGNKKWVKDLNCKQPAITEMVLDATLSTAGDPETADFVEVKGGSWNRYRLFDRTNHVTRGGTPVGANICFVDGHLEWRRFNQMEVRYVIPPYHWW